MFFKIIISLGLVVFLVDYTYGTCGLCLENHVACHSENTFSLCVEGNPTDSYVKCPKDSICTNDPAVCVTKSNDDLKPSCMTVKVPEKFGNSYKAPNVAGLTLTEDRALSDDETDLSSSTQGGDDEISASTQYSVSEDPLSTEYPEDETVSSVDDSSASSTDTTMTEKGITLIPEDLSSTTEATESAELSTSSTEDITGSDMSTTDIESTSSSITPRDATTFCSENKEVGTFEAEGDTTCKRFADKNIKFRNIFLERTTKFEVSVSSCLLIRFNMFKLITILIVVFGLSQIEGACNICNKHGFACVDKTSFSICIDGKVDKSMTLKCKEGEICTDMSMACVPTANSTAIPGCSSLCGVCEMGKTFACSSIINYQLCRDGEPTGIVGTCPGDKVCDTAGSSVCVRPCDVTNLICDKETPKTPSTTTPTITTSTTPTTKSTSSSTSSSSSSSSSSTSSSPRTPSSVTTPMTPTSFVNPTPTEPVLPTPTPTKTPQAICIEKQNPGRYPLDDDHSDACSNEYVFCRFDGSTLVAVPSQCPSGRSFNKATQSCETSPAGCDV
ncbi:mucin-5AC-like [Eupeodes corollae]|uniref:mucin-5AC-like n=1 Tax=Eupeodes corollae TaxID=290404 RepID=UPI00248FA2DB|nr:mucin-5AC-like [Eupeodes corollae]